MENKEEILKKVTDLFLYSQETHVIYGTGGNIKSDFCFSQCESIFTEEDTEFVYGLKTNWPQKFVETFLFKHLGKIYDIEIVKVSPKTGMWKHCYVIFFSLRRPDFWPTTLRKKLFFLSLLLIRTIDSEWMLPVEMTNEEMWGFFQDFPNLAIASAVVCGHRNSNHFWNEGWYSVIRATWENQKCHKGKYTAFFDFKQPNVIRNYLQGIVGIISSKRYLKQALEKLPTNAKNSLISATLVEEYSIMKKEL